MEIRRLMEFVVLAKHLNYKQASAELGISAATLSNRMMALENELGQELLEHKSRKVVLTESGELFLRDAIGLVDDYNRTCRRLQTVNEHSERSFTIAIAGCGMPPRIGIAINNLCERYPQLRLRLVDDAMCNMEESLKSGEVDVYFNYLETEKPDPDLHYHFLFSSQLCVLLPPDHKLSAHRSVEWKELAGETFIPYPSLAEDAIYQHGKSVIEQSGVRFMTLDTANAKTFYLHAVSAGLGFSLIPWVMRDYSPPHTVELPISGNVSTSLYMVFSRKNDSPVLKAFARDVERLDF